MMCNPSEFVWMLYGVISLHGICYDFFFVTGQIYVDERAPKNIKNAAQGLITFATYGVGMFIGSLLSGVIAENYTVDQSTYLWDKIWLIPAVLSAIVLVLFAVFFREKRAKRSADEIRTETSQAISESKPA